MSGIAQVLASEGYRLSGSELVANAVTQQLSSMGVNILSSHHADNVKGADVVVRSTAIASDNSEIVAAKVANIRVIHRAQMLAELMRFRHGITIAGTHGKTTTTAMVASIFVEAGLDPTFIDGGLMKNFGVYGRLGCGNYMIAEADESDASFLHLRPLATIITNIEPEHLYNYQDNFENVKDAYVKFLHNLPFYGSAVLCIDDPVIRKLLPRIDQRITTYGFSSDADFRIVNFNQEGVQSNFTLFRPKNSALHVELNAAGQHNALNAAAAIAIAVQEGIDDESVLRAMNQFQGTGRRFENLGTFSLKEVNGKAGNVLLIDNFGSHPTEVNVSIAAAHRSWPNKRLVLIFQPQRYQRVRDLFTEYVNVLSSVDVLLLLEVRNSGGGYIPGADSSSLCEAIWKQSQMNPILVSETNDLPKQLAAVLQDNDLVMTQGGAIGKIARKLAENELKSL